MAGPFVLLLAAIALAPLFFPDWWGKHYTKVAFSLAAFVVICYVFKLNGGRRVAGPQGSISALLPSSVRFVVSAASTSI